MPPPTPTRNELRSAPRSSNCSIIYSTVAKVFNLLGGLDRNEFIPFEKAEKGLQVAVDNDENPSALRNQGIQTAEIG